MAQFIRDLINAATAGLTALINAVASRILWVYNVFITVFIRIRATFDIALNRIRAGAYWLHNVVREAYMTLHWIVWIRIPQVVGNAVNGATNWLVAQLNNVQAFLRGLIDGLNAWIRQQIQRIDTFISDVIRWATTQINSIIDTMRHVVTAVTNLLTDPRRLAAWAIDAIIGEFLRWLDRNADRVFLIVRQRSIAYTLYFASRIEDMIARLL